MHTLILNSHSLSNFQRCPQLYDFVSIQSIEPKDRKKAWDKGTFVAKWLEIYYRAQLKPKLSMERILLKKGAWDRRAVEMSLSEEEVTKLFRACISYKMKWDGEDWTPLGTEVGFSKLLYESENLTIVYEGRIDLVATSDNKLLVIDHKTRAQRRDIYAHNNQVLGYLWATEATEFCYNYLTLTAAPTFERTIHKFSKDQIECWREDVIHTGERMIRSEYRRSFQCTSIYGTCEYSRLCESQHNPQMFDFMRETHFKKRPVYRSW